MGGGDERLGGFTLVVGFCLSLVVNLVEGLLKFAVAVGFVVVDLVVLVDFVVALVVALVSLSVLERFSDG